MKKAQAAMEFLMTYGWAILVVLIAIAALAYFGVLNPGRYLPSSCTLGTGLSCTDFRVLRDAGAGVGQVTLIVQNGMGQDLSEIDISIGGDCGVSTFAGPTTLDDGAEDQFDITCEDVISGSKFKEDINITYKGESGLSHIMTGSISSQVE